MKPWAHALLCLLLSSGIWLIYNLSQDYSGLVSVSVLAQSNIEGRSQSASAPVVVAATCRATGFRLLRLSVGESRPVRVYFEPSDLKPALSDEYSIGASQVAKYAQSIFGDGVSMENLVSDDVRFRFPAENCKKVPVRAVQTASYKPQYMPLHDILLTPDSVFVYGEPSRLESVEVVVTRPLNLGEVKSSVHGTVRLEKMHGVRFSDETVAYQLDVVRYVEISSTVHVHARNVPAGQHFSVLPSTASVRWRCVFPVSTDPSGSAEFYVDYAEFAESLSGKCLVHCDNLPDGVIDWEIEPRVCECVSTDIL